MSILTYFKPKDGLPNPKGPLSLSILLQAIALANREGYHRQEQETWPVQEAALRQLLPSILPDKHDRLIHVHCGSSDLTSTRFKISC